MKASRLRALRWLTSLLALLALAYVAASIPAPWVEARPIEGTVLTSEVTSGSKLEGGSKGFISVRLDDGTVASLWVNRFTVPPVGACVTVIVRAGLFGQRMYSPPSYAPPLGAKV
jgi:hypothetical protein